MTQTTKEKLDAFFSDAEKSDKSLKSVILGFCDILAEQIDRREESEAIRASVETWVGDLEERLESVEERLDDIES